MAEPLLVAARALLSVCHFGHSLNDALLEASAELEPAQQGLLRELSYGPLRQYGQLQGMLRQLMHKPLKDKDQDIYMLLLIASYQLLYMRKPPHAVVNNAVNTVVTSGKPWAKGMVNGILRNMQRRQDELRNNLSKEEHFSHPLWLIEALKAAWPEQWQDVLAANNQQPPSCLRVNPQHYQRDDYLQKLSDAEEGINAQVCALAEHGLRLARAIPVAQLPGFTEGAVSVQDEAAQLAGQLLELSSGQKVLDACAAPGGKSCDILERHKDIQLTALDISASRLSKVSENLERLQLSAELVAGDGCSPESWWDDQAFDRILLDAPCSATGVIRRNPDIKLHRQAKDITALCELQAQMLDALWPCLAPGGIMLYATCSVLPAENSEQIAAFLSRHTDAEIVPIDIGSAGPEGHCEFGRQLLPSANGPDGFYYAKLRKTG